MAWQKYATQHVPEWLSVRMTGLRESIEHIGFFAVSGLIAGLLYGSAIGWLKCDDLNAHQIARDKWQQAVERNNETWVEFCEDNPKSLQCGDNLKRLCKAQPDAAACKDYRTGSQARITQQGRPMAALLTWRAEHGHIASTGLCHHRACRPGSLLCRCGRGNAVRHHPAFCALSIAAAAMAAASASAASRAHHPGFAAALASAPTAHNASS